MKTHQSGARIERSNRHEIHSDDECHEGAFSKEFKNSDVFVATEGLAFPDEATIVRAGSGMPITDGVFPEAKEFLMGYWIVDVESPEQLRIGSPPRIRNGSGRGPDARIDGHRYCA